MSLEEARMRDEAIAAILLDSSSRAQYLLKRLCDIDERWESVSTGGLMKLGRRYRAVVVVQALAFCREEMAAPDKPYPFLEAVCVRIENEKLA